MSIILACVHSLLALFPLLFFKIGATLLNCLALESTKNSFLHNCIFSGRWFTRVFSTHSMDSQISDPLAYALYGCVIEQQPI